MKIAIELNSAQVESLKAIAASLGVNAEELAGESRYSHVRRRAQTGRVVDCRGDRGHDQGEGLRVVCGQYQRANQAGVEPRCSPRDGEGPVRLSLGVCLDVHQ